MWTLQVASFRVPMSGPASHHHSVGSFEKVQNPIDVNFYIILLALSGHKSSKFLFPPFPTPYKVGYAISAMFDQALHHWDGCKPRL